VLRYIDESLQFSPIGLSVPPILSLTLLLYLSILFAVEWRSSAYIALLVHHLHFIESCLSYAACIIDAIVCLGDFNVHAGSNYNAKLLLDITSLFSHEQLIDTSIRLTCNSAITWILFLSRRELMYCSWVRSQWCDQCEWQSYHPCDAGYFASWSCVFLA